MAKSTTKATAASLMKKLNAKFEKAGSTKVFVDYSEEDSIEVSVIPTPSSIINAVIGVGGFPRGLITELFGEEGTGKTTLAIEAAVQCQQQDPQAVILYADYEHAFDPNYAMKLGLDLDPERFIFIQPDTMEQGCETILEFVRADLVDLVVVDSVTAMTPRAEMEGDFDSAGGVGAQARMMSKWLRLMLAPLGKGREPAMVAICQMRMKIDFYNPRANGLDSAAANALKFYSSVRLKLDNARGEDDSEHDKDAVVDQKYAATRVRVTSMKNRVAKPFRQGRFVINFGEGINNIASILEMAEKVLGIRAGAWFKYTGPTDETSFAVQGRDATLTHLKNNPGAVRQLETDSIEALKKA